MRPSRTWICRSQIIALGRFTANGTFRMNVRSSGFKRPCAASGMCCKPERVSLIEKMKTGKNDRPGYSCERTPWVLVTGAEPLNPSSASVLRRLPFDGMKPTFRHRRPECNMRQIPNHCNRIVDHCQGLLTANEKAPHRGFLTPAHAGDPSPVSWIARRLRLPSANRKHPFSVQSPLHLFAPFAYLAYFAVSHLSYAC